MKRHPSRHRTRQTFTLLGAEHRSGRNGTQRLVCFVKGDFGLLVLFGSSDSDVRNIEAVERHGFPVTITCDWLSPNESCADHFRHGYWVDEDDYFEIVAPPA